jgi:phage antirepressor YoqD-like protein
MSNLQLTVKEVNFNGAELLAAQHNNGKIYVGVSWICQGIGFDKSQKDAQVQKVQSDLVLSRGCLKFQAGVFDPNNDVLAIELDYLPLWLAKISITPSMQTKHPELVDKLIEYQFKAKDVLSKAFIQETQVNSLVEDYISMSEEDRAIAYFSERKQKKQLEDQLKLVEPKVKKYDQLMNGENSKGILEVGKYLEIGEKKLFEFLRTIGVLMKTNLPYQEFENRGYFEVKVTPIAMGENVINKSTTRVTAKGMDFVVDLIGEYGGKEKINGMKLNEIKWLARKYNKR